MPGGVNSPVRAFTSVDVDPLFIEKAKGAYIWDIDGNKYTDYVLSWGPAIVGHANDEVNTAVRETLEKGSSFGAPCLLETELAKKVIEIVPSIEMVRFTSSGTEACMAALRVARAFTGKSAIVKFDGCYHGHADSFLVKAGSGVATLGLPNSPGVPKEIAENTRIATYNDASSVEALLQAKDVAAIFVEPVVGNAGFIAPDPTFLAKLRQLADQYGALLVFDEVMTGFRVNAHCAQGLYGVKPDLTTLGKVIGGGLPVGAFGGRRDIMSMVAPSGPVYQAGTLSGNPLAMAAGLKTLEILSRPGAYEQLNSTTASLVQGLQRLSQQNQKGNHLVAGHVGAMMGFFLMDDPNAPMVQNYEQAKKCRQDKFRTLHKELLKRGVYIAPSPFEASFTSLSHTSDDIQRTLQAFEEVLNLDLAV